MNIYQPFHNSDIYDSLYCINDNDYRIIKHFLGHGLYKHYEQAPPFWQLIPVSIEKMHKRCDFPGLSIALVCNHKAWQILEPLIKNSVELLPLQCDSGEYSIIKVIDVADCLDYSRAVVKRFDNGRVMHVVAYAFKDGCIGDRIIFKLPECGTRVFVSQAFKDCIESHGLKGLFFKQVA